MGRGLLTLPFSATSPYQAFEHGDKLVFVIDVFLKIMYTTPLQFQVALNRIDYEASPPI
jgi:hypothetical protein